MPNQSRSSMARVIPIPVPSASDIDRFWCKVDKSGGPGACWEWTASRDRDGYGRFWMARVYCRAHRVANAIVNGDVEALVIHSCDNPPCCNPAHLSGGTQKLNLDQMTARGRRIATPQLGESHGRHKLSVGAVRGIKDSVGLTPLDLARKYGISRSQVYAIRSGRSWKQI